ncbi:MAG: MFS transporter [Campylobacterota bacterium]|nr:MFS transporter [Campylobacterota bacterium]
MKTLLASFYFFYFGIVGIYIIFMPKVLTMLSYSSSEIGIIFTAAPFVRFLLPFIFKIGFKLTKKLFNISLVIMLGSAISFYLSVNNFYALFISNIGLGIGMGLILPYMEVIALEMIGKERYGKIRLFGSIGFILVALVLVQFLSSPDIALFYLLTFTLLTASIAFFIVKNIDETSKQKNSIKDDITLLIHWKLWLGLTLMQVSFGAFYNFFTIYETNYGISLDMTVNLWVFGVVAEIIMLYFQGRLLKFNLVLLLQITIFSTIIRWYLVYLFPQNITILFFSQSLHALSFALFYSASISYLHQLYTNKVLAQQFFSGVTFGLGGLIGAFGFGYIYEYYPHSIFLVASLIASLSFIFIHLWARSVKHS